MALYLSFKEVWRNRGRFVLFSLVIALITVLVLFVAALGEGLGSGNREFIQKLSGELLVYDSKADLQLGASRLAQSKLASVRRVDGVAEVGPLGFASAGILYGPYDKELKVGLIGADPGAPGEPTVVTGRQLLGRKSKEAVLDRNVAVRTGVKVGDIITVRATQGTDTKLYPLRVVGISDGQQYGLQPTVIMPFRTWDQVRPQATMPTGDDSADLVANAFAVMLRNPADLGAVQQRIEQEVRDVRVVDRVTAYMNAPGYTAQQSTLDTQKYFALLIGVLVIGGFFQIQMLQKVPQIGMLKAIGASNVTVAVAAIIQIILVTMMGVGLGVAGTLLLSLSFPPGIPIVFNPNAVMASVISLLLIGPIGGLVSIRYSVRVEPLTALGLG